jgi:hypothetical protein
MTDQALARLISTISARLETRQQRVLAGDPHWVGHAQHYEQGQLQAGQQPDRVDRQPVGQQQLQRDRDEDRSGDREPLFSLGHSHPGWHPGVFGFLEQLLAGTGDRVMSVSE